MPRCLIDCISNYQTQTLLLLLLLLLFILLASTAERWVAVCLEYNKLTIGTEYCGRRCLTSTAASIVVRSYRLSFSRTPLTFPALSLSAASSLGTRRGHVPASANVCPNMTSENYSITRNAKFPTAGSLAIYSNWPRLLRDTALHLSVIAITRIVIASLLFLNLFTGLKSRRTHTIKIDLSYLQSLHHQSTNLSAQSHLSSNC